MMLARLKVRLQVSGTVQSNIQVSQI